MIDDEDDPEDPTIESDRRFRMSGSDFDAAELAMDKLRNLVRCRDLSGRDLIGVGQLLSALERLPLATLGASCSVGLEYRGGEPGSSELLYADIRIDEESFEISAGGSSYSREFGGDSYSLPGWSFSVYGRGNSEGDLRELGGLFDRLMELGAAVRVAGDSLP